MKIVIACLIISICLQVNFLDWQDGEPNNRNNVESCVELYLNRWRRTGTWNDVHCEKYNEWLCQIRAGKSWSLGYMGFKGKTNSFVTLL